MKILHTSDWHLGKSLERASRIEEQKLFIEEIVRISDNEKIDFIIIAGDIYDTNNPSAEAEALFYEAVSKLTKGGARPMLVISGNHDSPKRLSAATPVIREMGIIMVDSLDTTVSLCQKENYAIVESGRGFFEIEINKERLVAVNMPYPSEKRLNEIITEFHEESKMQKDYSQKIGSIFKELSEHFRADTINIATGHFYIRGGAESTSERSIQLGGSLAINPADLPEKAQYIAMGHLHRPQRVGGTENAYYSGSPLEYSVSEINYPKSVYIAELTAGKEAEVKKIPLKKHKPIEVWKAESIEEAIAMSEAHRERNSWVYLDIKTDRVIEGEELKKIHTHKKDILQINAVLPINENKEFEALKEYTFEEDFYNFYKHIKGVPPSEDVMEIFLEIYNETENEIGHGEDKQVKNETD